jgi:hypothetical protein
MAGFPPVLSRVQRPLNGRQTTRLGRRWQGSTGEAVQGRSGRRAGFGRVDDEGQPDVGRKGERFVVKREVTDQGMVERLGAGPVLADVVGGPADPEGLASGGELANEVAECAVA